MLGRLRAALRDYPTWRLREQFLYGHREILLDYANLSRDLVIDGRIQHGWDLWFEGSTAFRGPGLRSSWQWVWARDAEHRARSLGVPKVVAIGSPWLYLQKLAALDSHLTAAVVVGSTERPSGVTLFIPAHYGPFATVELHARHVDVIQSDLDPSGTSVLLHGYDFLRPDVRDLYLEAGVRVFCLGYPGYTPRALPYSADIGNRVRFLWDLNTLFQTHSRVATDFMGSHVFYAASLGLPIGYWPIPQEMWQSLVAQHDSANQDLFGRMARLESSWKNQLQHTFGVSNELATLATQVLGAESLMEPEQLRDVLRLRSHRLPDLGAWTAPDRQSKL